MAKHSLDAPARSTQKSRPELNLGKIINNRISLLGIIGTGEYGAVYSAYDIYSNEKLAVKALSKNGCGITNIDSVVTHDAKRRKLVYSNNIDTRYLSFEDVSGLAAANPSCRAYKEAHLHVKVHGHPNILSVLEILDSEDYLYLILEYFPRGDLFHCITDLRWYVGDDLSAKAIFSQIADAVSYCHKNGVYHCDLKPENILVSNDGSTVRLADFGLATTDAISSDFGCGSTFYMAPERIKSSANNCLQGFSTASGDIWALGIILLNLTCGRNPWRKASSDDASYRAFLVDDYFLHRILPITPELNGILRRVFKRSGKYLTPEALHWLVVMSKQLTMSPSTESPQLPPTPAPSPPLSSESKAQAAKAAANAAAQAALAPVSPVSPPSAMPSSPHLIGLGLLPPFGITPNKSTILPPITTINTNYTHVTPITPSTTPIISSPTSATKKFQYRPITTDTLPLTPILS